MVYKSEANSLFYTRGAHIDGKLKSEFPIKESEHATAHARAK